MWAVTYKGRPATVEKLWNVLELHQSHLPSFELGYITSMHRHYVYDAYMSITGENWFNRPKEIQVARMELKK
jgi:hypothetical protein